MYKITINQLEQKLKSEAGFSLPELLIATVLLSVIFIGVLLTMLKCIELDDIARNSSAAVIAAKSKMAAIDNTAFAQIYANFNNVAFNVTGFNGKGVTYVNNATPSILTITTVVCWKQPNGRMFGEDTNLNGQLNTGEDRNGNGTLDSRVQFTTVKYDE